jgi:hypothetical protein
MSRLGSAQPPVALSKKKAIARLAEAQRRMLRHHFVGNPELHSGQAQAGWAARMSA